MGEVYRARDTKLDRDVALKILPESFASDPDRLMRFEREAKTLATLNHPHIAQIYGFEQGHGASALIMELVDGEDLSQRLLLGPIPVDETIGVVRKSGWKDLDCDITPELVVAGAIDLAHAAFPELGGNRVRPNRLADHTRRHVVICMRGGLYRASRF